VAGFLKVKRLLLMIELATNTKYTDLNRFGATDGHSKKNLFHY